MKVSSDSGEQLALFHLTAPPMSGLPLHVHTREDEVFYVLEGELVFEVDGARHTVSAGGTVYLRRGVPHRYQNFASTPARILLAVTPGAFHDFLVALAAATAQAGGGLPPLDVLQSLDGPYGVTTLGPPMMEP